MHITQIHITQIHNPFKGGLLKIKTSYLLNKMDDNEYNDNEYNDNKDRPLVVVGINDSHDASACVVIDGRLICAISEERCQRVKNMGGFPKNAVEKCLEIAGISKSDVDFVAVGNINVSCANLHNTVPSMSIIDDYIMEEEYWQPVIYENKDVKLRELFPDYKPKGTLYYPMEEIPFAFNRELGPEIKEKVLGIRKSFIADYFGLREENIIFMDHHTCHAYYAYYANPLRKTKDTFLVLTSDAGGDAAYESINVFRKGKFECLHKGYDNIVAKIYNRMTLFMGMKPHEHEYKVMGLSAYAKEHEKKKPREIFTKSLTVDGLKFIRNPEVKDSFKYFQDRLKGCRFDGIAGGLQDFAENIMIKWVSNAVEQTGIKDVVMSGGLGLNIKVNKKIIELPQIDSFFVPPGAGDESLSVGACYAFLDKLKADGKCNFEIPQLQHAYLGNEAVVGEREELLNHPLIKDKYEVITNASPEDIAEILCRGEICGIFIGAMEFGPRALGHRSIIADPSRPEMVEKINEAIKKRDFWMPFTPSVLAERIDNYVVNPKNINCSYMTISFDTTELGKKHLAAAIHPHDKTARPQKVEKEISPIYHAIIKAFENRTGIGAVLNTSLNIHGKPIIMKPVEIAEELLSSDGVELNNIYVDGLLLKKKEEFR